MVEGLDPGLGHLLTCGQERMLPSAFRDGDPHPALWVSYQINGPLCVPSFIEALRETVRRCHALRISISDVPGEGPRQHFRPEPASRDLITCLQVQSRSTEQFAYFAKATLVQDLSRAWDLSEEYPFRFHLLKYSDNLHAFLATVSHLAVDYRGRETVLRLLWSLYSERTAGTPLEVTLQPGPFPLEISQLDGLHHSSHEETHRFWTGRTAGLPPLCQFSEIVDAPSTTAAGEGSEGDGPYGHVSLKGEPLHVLRESARQSKCTEFQWVLAAFAAAVFHYCVQDRIPIAIPFDTRPPGHRGAPGMWSVALPIVLRRTDAAGSLLDQVRKELLAAAAHRDVASDSLTEMGERVQRRWGAARRSNLAATYLRDDDARHDFHIGPCRIVREVYSPDVRFRSSGIYMSVASRPDLLDISFSLSAKHFPGDRARDFLDCFQARLEDMASHSVHRNPGAGAPDGVRTTRRNLRPLVTAHGESVRWVDVNTIADVLAAHPLIESAEVAIKPDSDGGTALAATVTTRGSLSRADIVSHFERRQEEDDYLLVPSSVSILRMN